MNAKNSNNCCINYKSDNKITLEEIGNIFDVTRMRICQIEKNAIKKIKKYFFAT
jgi:DNA-directed RNA polymerase sigma subunit (sigma70/sigma32)